MIKLTQDLLKELFDYRDGNLYWKVMKGSRAKIGDRAGTAQKNGYRQIRINGELYYAHRLIFLYHHRHLPKELDHIDGDKLNNDIANLREVIHQENQWNQKKIKSINGKLTSSIYKGVHWNKQHKKWQSQITINAKKKHLGYFDSEIEAAKAYNRAASEYFGEFARMIKC